MLVLRRLELVAERSRPEAPAIQATVGAMVAAFLPALIPGGELPGSQ